MKDEQNGKTNSPAWEIRYLIISAASTPLAASPIVRTVGLSTCLGEPIDACTRSNSEKVLDSVHDSGRTLGNEELQRFCGNAIHHEESDQGPPGTFRPPSRMNQDTQDGEKTQVYTEFTPRKDWDTVEANQCSRVRHKK
jgi:hypothetical protein